MKDRVVRWLTTACLVLTDCLCCPQQIHLGSFSLEEEAARAFDRIAIRLRGPNTFTNFPPKDYSLSSSDSEATAKDSSLSGLRYLPQDTGNLAAYWKVTQNT